MNDKVCVEVWIDRSRQGAIHEATYETASSFRFQKGHIHVINHTSHVGIYGQWMGTWQPTFQSQEIAVILEDDLTVSPFFYRYLKNVHKKYDNNWKVNGYALHCSEKHGNSARGYVQAPDENVVFTYPIIGTWRFSPQKVNWLNFTNWYKTVYMNTDFRPFVQGIMLTSWYKGLLKSGRADTMWEMWHIFYAFTNKEVTIYPGVNNCEGFTINWREIGLHYDGTSKIVDHVIAKWNTKYESLPDKPIHMNVHGQKMSPIIDMGKQHKEGR